MNDNQWIFMVDNLSVDFMSAWSIATYMINSNDIMVDSLAMYCSYDGI
jgi:hypothetical protein